MFVVIELQTYESGAVGNIISTYDTLNEAEAKYHTILAAAAVSSLPVHSAFIVTNTGNVVRSEYYRHGEEIQNEEE